MDTFSNETSNEDKKHNFKINSLPAQGSSKKLDYNSRIDSLIKRIDKLLE